MLAVGQSEISNIQFACVESMQFICLFQIINCKQLVPADALIFDCGELPEGAANGGAKFFKDSTYILAGQMISMRSRFHGTCMLQPSEKQDRW
jgi:hypothetical protein